MNKKIFLLAIFISFCMVFVFSSCKKKENSEMSVKKERVYAVVIEQASVSSVQDYLTASGEVEAKTNVAVFPEIGGKVASLSVELSDVVSKGQIIAYVDPNKPGAYYANSPVKSPISGTVTQIISRPGTTVTTGTAVIKVGDIRNLVVYSDISERYVGGLALGQIADIMLPAYPNELFKGRIVRISPVLDPVSRSKQVEIAFDRYDERINSGMFPKVKIYTSVYNDKIVLPSEAVVTRNNCDFVYTVEKNQEGQDIARRIPVKKIVSVDKFTVLESGVSLGQPVIVEGMDILVDGARINIMSK